MSLLFGIKKSVLFLSWTLLLELILGLILELISLNQENIVGKIVSTFIPTILVFNNFSKALTSDGIHLEFCIILNNLTFTVYSIK